MDALVQFFTAVAAALAAMALSHFGVAADSLTARVSRPPIERSVERSPAPAAFHAPSGEHER